MGETLEKDQSGTRHWPELDGVRGIAVLVVVIYHLETPGWMPLDRGGWLGVELFFVLSGFLITNLLIAEFGRSDRISLEKFYGRRAVRLLPAQWTIVAFVALFAILFTTDPDRGDLLSGVPSSLLYFSNWVKAYDWWPQKALTHTWSLAIEEQYYLIWPPIALFILRRGTRRSSGRKRNILYATAAFAVVTLGLRTAMYLGGVSLPRLYNGTDARSGALMLGSLLGAAVATGAIKKFRYATAATVAGVGGFVILAVLVSQTRLSVGLGLTAVDGVIALGILGCVFVDPKSLISKALRFGPLVKIGHVSYGLYLWHKMTIVIFDGSALGLNWWQEAACEIALFSVATALSWKLIEKPAQRFRARFNT